MPAEQPFVWRTTSRVLVFWAMVAVSKPVQAQSSPSLSVNVGAPFPRDSAVLENTLRISCSTTHTGVCLDGNFGFDWGAGNTGYYYLGDVDVGFSAALGNKRRTSIVLRAGGSGWQRGNEKTGKYGFNGGLAIRHLVRARKAWRLDLNWREFPGLTWPSVTVGLEWNSP
jgi:hypothetical protein